MRLSETAKGELRLKIAKWRIELVETFEDYIEELDNMETDPLTMLDDGDFLCDMEEMIKNRMKLFKTGKEE